MKSALPVCIACAAAGFNIVLSVVLYVTAEKQLNTANYKYTEAEEINRNLYSLPSIEKAINIMKNNLKENYKDKDIAPFYYRGKTVLELLKKSSIEVKEYNFSNKELIFNGLGTADRIIPLIHTVSFTEDNYSIRYLEIVSRDNRCSFQLIMGNRNE